LVLVKARTIHKYWHDFFFGYFGWSLSMVGWFTGWTVIHPHIQFFPGTISDVVPASSSGLFPDHVQRLFLFVLWSLYHKSREHGWERMVEVVFRWYFDGIFRISPTLSWCIYAEEVIVTGHPPLFRSTPLHSSLSLSLSLSLNCYNSRPLFFRWHFLSRH